jgi:tRNA-2-methylthio-N6-dimethylallyladenosine synthase
LLPGWHAGAEVGRSDESQDAAGALVQLTAPPTLHSLLTQLVGRTPCDRIVVFDGNPRLAGTTARIAIDDCTATTLLGTIVTRHLQPGSSELLPILV